MPGKNIIGTDYDDNIVLTDALIGYYKNGKFVADKTLQSTQGDDTISTGAGNDIVKGEMGNDVLSGGTGNDKVHGGSGNDLLNGDEGNDTLYGGTGNDTLNGGIGNDKMRGGFGNDLLNGGDGDDTLRGGSDSDTLNGGNGNDVLIGGGNNEEGSSDRDDESEDESSAASAPEVLSGGAGNDRIYGGSGNDKIYGGDDSDVLRGGRGDDSIEGDSGNDYLFGGSGNDTLNGGDGDDKIYGRFSEDVSLDEEDDAKERKSSATDEFGREILSGGAGNDKVYGGRGSDQLFGGEGIDRLYGGSGNDRLQGDGGADYLRGGQGNDTYVFTSVNDSATTSGIWDNNKGDTISGFTKGSDKIDLKALSDLQWSGTTPAANGVWYKIDGGHTYLHADTTGDGVADLAIRLKGKINLAESDILLGVNNRPQANNDAGSATEQGIAAGSDATGNVLTGAGADASPNGDALTVTAVRTGAESGTGTAGSVGATLQGQYGSLTLNADGSYSYHPNDANPAVNALNGSETLADNFTYTITNAHGGTDQATLTISINGANDAPLIDSNGGADTAVIAVNENVLAVTTVHATDVDHGDVATYSISGGADKDVFTIDATTGVISFKNAPNAEAPIDADGNNSYEVIVQVADGHGGFDTQTLTINVNDANEFSVSAPIDNNATPNGVDENAATGMVVGITAAASDSDATNNGVTYSLTDNAGGKFAIDANTGIVTVAGAIDYETNTGFNITVRATSADGSTADSTFAIGVNDVSEYSVTAPLDSDATANVVDENAGAGTVVGITAAASDGDASNNGVTYLLVNDAGGKFVIDATTGVVTTSGTAIDRETADSLHITVRATSADGSVADTGFNIAIDDANEFAVSTPVDNDAGDNTVVENSAVGTVVGVTALASDADATTNGVTYSLVNDAGGKFAIDATTGIVTVAGVIDREEAATLDITVRATSVDGSTADAIFTVGVTELNEFSASTPLDNNGAANTIDENVAAGTVIPITALAADGDATNNGITYSLTNDADGKFAIDAITGVVTTTGVGIDREASANLGITIRATSADGSHADANFTIGVNDVNEFTVTTPVDDNANDNILVDNVAAGTVVGITALASDADATTNGVTYSLTDDASGRFAIDATTGVVTTTGAALSVGNLSVTIRASSADGSQADANFAITINSSNAAAPVFTSGSSGSEAENTAADNVVYNANATDADGNTVTYSLTGDDAALFSIDAATGEVRFLNSPDYETPLDTGANNLYNIVVHANDGVHDSTRNVGITVTDVVEVIPNLSAPVFTSGATASESENTTASFVVYDANATDADGDILTYSLTGDDAALFSIDASTGQVRFLSSPDHENPLDVGANNLYDITVHANDGTHDTTLAVGITVTNIPESTDPDPNDFDAAGNGLSQTGTGTFAGTAGSDTLVGSGVPDNVNASDGADIIYGRDGNDSINGSLGDDTLYGQTGNDNLVGGNQNDIIYGGSGDDNLVGGSGNDVVYGGSGTDTLNGGAGNDTMIGGYGADTLIDGSGTDRFVYLSLFDGGDSITGVTSTSVIDLTALDANETIGGDNLFTFVAAQNTNTVAHSITWSQDGTNTYLRADVNGDSVADFELTLTGTVNLTETMLAL